MSKKIVIVALFVFYYPISLFSNGIEDRMLKDRYPALPTTAAHIKVLNNSLNGDFVEYYDNEINIVFINRDGKLKSLNKDIYDAIMCSSSRHSLEEIQKNKPIITCFNCCDHAVGYLACYSEGNCGYFPFFWSPEACTILPDLNSNAFVNFTMPHSVNKYGIVVGYCFKTFERTFYVGPQKKEMRLLCRELVLVIWPNLSTIKEITLYADKHDALSYLSDKNGLPNFLTIDDDGFIHFWTETKSECAGSLHMNELE